MAGRRLAHRSVRRACTRGERASTSPDPLIRAARYAGVSASALARRGRSRPQITWVPGPGRGARARIPPWHRRRLGRPACAGSLSLLLEAGAVQPPWRGPPGGFAPPPKKRIFFGGAGPPGPCSMAGLPGAGPPTGGGGLPLGSSLRPSLRSWPLFGPGPTIRWRWARAAAASPAPTAPAGPVVCLLVDAPGQATWPGFPPAPGPIAAGRRCSRWGRAPQAEPVPLPLAAGSGPRRPLLRWWAALGAICRGDPTAGGSASPQGSRPGPELGRCGPPSGF